MKLHLKKIKHHRGVQAANRVELWWNVTIVLAFIANVLIVLASLYVFREVDKGEFFVAKKPTHSLDQVIDPAQLHKVIETMETRKKNLENARDTRSILVDPSL